MKVVINGKPYQQREIETLSIRRALQFDRECEEHDLPWRWLDVERAIGEMRGLPQSEAQAHPFALVLTALSVWASMLADGEDVTFNDVLDLPLDVMQFVSTRPAPQDHKDPQKARPVSGRADAPHAKARRPKKATSAKTSKATSTDG